MENFVGAIPSLLSENVGGHVCEKPRNQQETDDHEGSHRFSGFVERLVIKSSLRFVPVTRTTTTV